MGKERRTVRLPASPELADGRTLRILDFPAVQAELAARCASALGRERALALVPLARRREVLALLAETAEARALADQGAPPPLSGLTDLRAEVGRAGRGGVLGAPELHRVGQAAAALCLLADHSRRHALAAPHLAEWGELIADFRQLAEELARCVSLDGEVSDRASPELAAARRQARLAEAALRDRLEALVHSAALEGALQEPLVTQRRDRFVLPVKSDARALVPGLVHDQSASGATVFIEPLAVVELGNRLRAAQAAVANEVARILAALSEQVGSRAVELARALDAAGHLDLAAAKAQLARDWDATPPEILEQAALDLVGARHPLIGGPVPVDIRLGLDFDALVLTGPNTGGKTVCLKITGLFVCMAQAGLQLPAERARLGIFPVVCGDAGDDQGVAQSLSTFSSHMRAVVAAERLVVPGAVVLLDELGAGTDPGEGAVLAMALLEHLLGQGALVLVTTHASELKAFAHRTPRVENASVAFDPETLSPTYRLVIGVPGPSQALAIAERLGLPGPIVERARALRGPDARAVEQLIAGMASNERQLQAAAAEAAEEARRAATVRAQLDEERQELALHRAELLAAARAEAAEVVADARRQADAAVRQLKRLTEEGRAGALVQAEAERERLLQAGERLVGGDAPPVRLHVGQTVRIRSLDRQGVLVQAPAEGMALVECGRVRLNVPVSDVLPAAPLPEAKPKHPPRRVEVSSGAGAATVEHDLRGLDRWEALERVDKALDDAVLAGLSHVRLIHGKGTGALREAVGEFLRGHPQVRGFRLGAPSEGGAGATVVELRT